MTLGRGNEVTKVGMELLGQLKTIDPKDTPMWELTLTCIQREYEDHSW